VRSSVAKTSIGWPASGLPPAASTRRPRTSTERRTETRGRFAERPVARAVSREAGGETIWMLRETSLTLPAESVARTVILCRPSGTSVPVSEIAVSSTFGQGIRCVDWQSLAEVAFWTPSTRIEIERMPTLSDASTTAASVRTCGPSTHSGPPTEIAGRVSSSTVMCALAMAIRPPPFAVHGFAPQHAAVRREPNRPRKLGVTRRKPSGIVQACWL